MKKSKVFKFLYRQERRHNRLLEKFIQKILELNANTNTNTAEDSPLSRPVQPEVDQLSPVDPRELRAPPGQNWQSEYV
jgi:rubrerythrin